MDSFEIRNNHATLNINLEYEKRARLIPTEKQTTMRFSEKACSKGEKVLTIENQKHSSSDVVRFIRIDPTTGSHTKSCLVVHISRDCFHDGEIIASQSEIEK